LDRAKPRARPVTQAVLAAALLVLLAGCAPTGPSVVSPTSGSLGVSPSAAGASPGPTGSSGAGVGPSISAGPQPTSSGLSSRRVWWIILENHEAGSIIGSPQAPYLNSLVDRYGLATNYYATSHPSEPNYVSLVAGSTLGVTSDGTYHLDSPSLFSELATAGLAWRVYAQDDRPDCYTGSSAYGGTDGPGAPGAYARKHNPAISFVSVADHPDQCRNIQPLAAFDPNAGAFEMIVPNLINDMHDGTLGQGDAFLKAFVPSITASPAFEAGGVLFITFDEGSTSDGSLGDHGGHVATVIVAPGGTAGFRDQAYADHWSLLRTTEDVLGLPCLAGACQRTALALH